MEIHSDRVPIARILGQAAFDDPAQKQWRTRVARGYWRQLVVDNRIQRRGGRLPPEGGPTRGHLLEDQTERELIGTEAGCGSSGLLRAHVGNRSGPESQLRLRLTVVYGRMGGALLAH